MNPAPRVHPGLMEDLASVDITDARYASLVHEKRLDGECAVLDHFLQA